jgi:hypothetical protein
MRSMNPIQLAMVGYFEHDKFAPRMSLVSTKLSLAVIR